MKRTTYIGILPKANLRALGLELFTTPLGQLILASQLKRMGIHSFVFDEDITTRNTILSFIKTQEDSDILVGLTVTSGNLINALHLGAEIKNIGIKVILGGPEISMAGPKVLSDHPYIEGIAVGPSESLIYDIVHNRTADRYYEQGDSWGADGWVPPSVPLDFQNIEVDYSLLVDIEKLQGVSYLWGNDCANARRRCYFCGRLSMGKGYRPPEKVWQELLPLYRKGMRRFYNTTDSVTTDVAALKRFVSAKPAEMTEDKHRVFVNANEITDQVIEAFVRLNGVAVMGFESFSLYDKSGKYGGSVERNLQAIEQLVRNRIPIVLSFVLGLPGESGVTLTRTCEGIVDLVRKHGEWIESIHLSPLLITTGSPAYNQLFSLPQIADKYKDASYPYDPVSTSRDYFDNLCSISRQEVIQKAKELIRQINDLSPGIRIGLKGILEGELKSN
jgi:radical SAM superfamily enzyme YgiQ (UPF0313 family)